MLKSQRTPSARDADWGRDSTPYEKKVAQTSLKNPHAVNEGQLSKMMEDALEVAKRGGFTRGKLPPAPPPSSAANGGKKTAKAASIAAAAKMKTQKELILLFAKTATKPLTSKDMSERLGISRDSSSRALRQLYTSGFLDRVHIGRGAFGYEAIK